MNASQVKSATTAELVAFYNSVAEQAEKATVKKFADRKTAERRVLEVIDAMAAIERSLSTPAGIAAITKTTKAGATVTIRPAAGAPKPDLKPAPTRKAAATKPAADAIAYKIGDASKVKRGAIFEAVTALAKRASFTRADFCAKCGGEVNALSHFYWAKRHGVVVEA